MNVTARIATAPDWRDDFPALDQCVHKQPLVYLDSAASAQQPNAVIDAVADYQRHDHANVHRGVHELSGRATEAFESARDKIAGFINANSRSEVVLTKGTTESINLVAQSFCRPRLQPGDRIVITHLEHHANIVPWQIVCEQTGAELVVAPINARGEVEIEALLELIDDRTFLVAIAHVSNALGTVCPVERVIEHTSARGIPVLVDGAQAVPHRGVDVQDLGCDFYAFSGHKMFGPTGTGVLWGREELLDAMPPWQGGGVQSFLLQDIHSHDLGTILDHQGVAIRTGHHCAMPVMQFFNIPGTARASLALYNNHDDIDRLVAALVKAREIFA